MLYPGHYLEPNEAEMLARVCRTICAENGLPLVSPNAEQIAAHLLQLFLNGLTVEEELLDAERNRAKRTACKNLQKAAPSKASSIA